MRLFKKNDTQKNNKKLPMTGRVKKGFRFYCMVVMAMTVVLGSSVTAFAAGDPITVVNKSVRLYLRSGKGCRNDYAWLWYRADWFILEISRPISESKRLSDPCRRRCDYLCKRDFDPYHRLILAFQRHKTELMGSFLGSCSISRF